MKPDYSGVKKDIRKFMTKLTEAQKYIEKLTYYDSLTKLPNRDMLINLFNQTLEKPSNTEKAIYLIDIDRFHTVNELYGRETGDMILIEFAKRLKELFDQKHSVFRSGEDEFYVYLENISYHLLTEIGDKIREAINTPFHIDGRRFYLTASIGISHYPTTGTTIKSLLHQAEIAMFKVKTSGKNNYHVIMRNDTRSVERKRRIEFGLNEVLYNDELYLVYQPQIHLKTGQMVATEALLRWDHPELGAVSPAEFIPIAEESGIINEIGDWVLTEAIRQTKEWHDMGLELGVSVNISPIQFYDKHLPKKIIEVVDRHGFDPCQLVVEVTESVMKDLKEAEFIAKELHNYQIQIAIDDFGTGYSSLSVLSNSHINMVKIDRAFVKDIPYKENIVSLHTKDPVRGLFTK